MLRIVGQRSDGYHLLQTVFQFLDFGDSLRFRVREDGVIKRIGNVAGVPQEEDLVVRAARLLQRRCEIPLGVEIELQKRLPMGGGLGGGSSDAATALLVLNRLWCAAMSTQQLALLGLTLGADVPVFVHGQAAWAEGVGEQLQPLELPEPWYLVLTPACSVPTADIFSNTELTRDSPRIRIRDFLAGSVENDCLRVVLRGYPEVSRAWRRLSQFAAPRLTGTGSCIFAEFESEASASEVAAQLSQEYQAFVARGLNRSPLLGQLSQ